MFRIPSAVTAYGRQRQLRANGDNIAARPSVWICWWRSARSPLGEPPLLSCVASKPSGALDLLSLGQARRPKIHGRGPATLGTCKHLLLRRAWPPASAFRVDGGSSAKVTSAATPVERGPTVNPASSNSSAARQPAMPGLRDLPLLRLRQVALAPSRGSRLSGACSG